MTLKEKDNKTNYNLKTFTGANICRLHVFSLNIVYAKTYATAKYKNKVMKKLCENERENGKTMYFY